MANSPERRAGPRSRRRSDRGVTLLEALIAAAILIIGLAGALSGILVASRQNAMAAKMARASAYGTQMRELLQVRGIAWLKGPNGPLQASNCTTDAKVRALAGDLAGSSACVIDLDALEKAQSVVANRLMPGYPQDTDETRSIRRLLVHRSFTDRDELTILVGWSELGLRRVQKQLLVFYNPTANETGFEI